MHAMNNPIGDFRDGCDASAAAVAVVAAAGGVPHGAPTGSPHSALLPEIISDPIYKPKISDACMQMPIRRLSFDILINQLPAKEAGSILLRAAGMAPSS